VYFRIPEIKGFPKICILPKFQKLFFPRFFPYDVMAPSAAWASPISGPGSSFKNCLCYFSNNIKKVCHEKFQGTMTFLLGCCGGTKIEESISTIKGRTVVGKKN
jgi:hypothetical protein